MALHRAFSLLTVKSVDDGRRVIKGIASSPTTDRVGDVVEPLGARFQIPMPLLLYHDSKMPVGQVDFARPNKEGIPFEASLPNVTEPGIVQDRVNEAFHSLKYKLIGAVSIGFNALANGVELLKSGGLRFTEWEWLELSLCAVPANPDAVIQSFKSMDSRRVHLSLGIPLSETDEQRAALIKQLTTKALTPSTTSLLAALGKEQQSPGPGVSGPTRNDANPEPRQKGQKMNLATNEQIAAYEARRAAQAAQLNEITKAAAARGETKSADEREQFDTIVAEIGAIDAELKDLRVLERMNVASATPVDGTSTKGAVATRDRVPVQIKHNEKLGPGIELVRLGLAMAQSKKEHKPVAEVMAARYPNSERLNQIAKSGLIENVLIPMSKAAVNAGSTQDPTWAAPLVAYNTFAGDFVAWLRPMTLVGRLPNLRQVPFNTHINGQTSGGVGYWVGEGAAKPLTKFDYNRTYIPFTKVAGITVITDELARFSTPAAEAMVRDGLRDALVERMDIDFIDPAHAAVANVSPASMLNGVTAITPSGTNYAAFITDLESLWAPALAVNMPTQSAVYVMDSLTALRVSNIRTQLGEMAYPSMTLTGGNIGGVPVVVSNYVPHNTAGGIIALLFTSEIWLADDGDVTVDISNEASLQMMDNPANTSYPAAPQQLVSMFQTDSTAIRAHRFIYWAKRRALAASYISGAHYS